MGKHTPGPWEVYKTHGIRENWPGIEAPSSCLSLVVLATDNASGKGVRGRNREEAFANAYIMAAAPAMYEALKELRSFMWAEGYADQSEAMAKADAALKQAEGRDA